MNKLIIALILTSGIVYQPYQVDAAAETTKSSTEINLDQAAALIVDKTNTFRRDHQLQALATNANLNQTAQQFAEFMAETNKYGHRADGQTPAERARAAGYDYCAIRENIGYRMDTRDITAANLGQFFTEGWIGSPAHRENILAKYATETGVGVATTDGLTFFAVQLFGRPKSAAYEVTLINTTASTQTVTIEGEDRSQSMDLSPLTTLKMERCFPITITIEDSAVTESIDASAALEINRSDEGELRLSRM